VRSGKNESALVRSVVLIGFHFTGNGLIKL